MSSRVTLVFGVYLCDAVQNIQSPRLTGDVGVMILLGQRGAGVVFAIFGSYPFQLVEELVQFSPPKPPLEQTLDLLCWPSRLVAKRLA